MGKALGGQILPGHAHGTRLPDKFWPGRGGFRVLWDVLDNDIVRGWQTLPNLAGHVNIRRLK